MIAAEDTRHSGVLLKHYEINVPLVSYFEHNSFSRIPQIIEHLKDGQNVAVITDAGTPGISDPAYRIIRAAIEENIRVEAVPGASALLAGLVSSGLPTDRFIFEGFLPPKKGRKKRLEAIKNESASLIFYESPKRLQRTLRDLFTELGDRPAVICRELTKLHEEIKRGTLSELLKFYTERQAKGECVIIVGKDDENVYFSKG